MMTAEPPLLFTDAPPPALTDRESLITFLETRVQAPKPHTRESLDALTPVEREQYDCDRFAFLSGGIVFDRTEVVTGRRLLRRAMDSNRARNSGHVGLMITGPAGSGKTTTAKSLMRWVFESYSAAVPEWRSFDHVPVVYVEVPARCTEKSLLKEFANFMGIAYLGRDSMTDLRRMVVSALRKARTQLVVVDEVHNLGSRSPGHSDAINVLKGLNNDLNATFALAGIDLTSGALLSGAQGQQIASRFSVLTLERYKADGNMRAWREIVAAFENQLYLVEHPRKSLDPLCVYLHHRTGGGISALNELLTGKAMELIRFKQKEHITKELLDDFIIDQHSHSYYESTLARRPSNRSKKVA